MRLPSTFCCPRQEIIWDILILLPLEPALTIITKRLFLLKLSFPIFPAPSFASFKILFTLVSNSSTLLLPVLFSNIPRCVSSMRLLTSFFLFVITSEIFWFVCSSAIKSLIPTEYELDFIYSFTIC